MSSLLPPVRTQRGKLTNVSQAADTLPAVDDVTVSIPARTEFVRLLRNVVSSAASRLHFGYDEIDDLRLAVDEACSHLLEAKPSPDAILLKLHMDDERIEVSVRGDTSPSVWPVGGARETLAWQVLNALTDEARFERVDGGVAVAFSKGAGTAEPSGTVSG